MILRLNDTGAYLECYEEPTIVPDVDVREQVLPFRIVDRVGRTSWVFLTFDELRRLCGHLLSMIPRENPRGV